MNVLTLHIQRTEGCDEIPQHPLERLRPLREDFQLRMNTFQAWTKSEISPNVLCENGFYYIGIEDKVQCTYCGGVLSGLSANDDVSRLHAMHFGQCELISTRNNNYIRHDIDNGNKYASYNERLSTFTYWPTSLQPRPTELASAGLYYTGKEDKCRCYSCGGYLFEWEPNDNPQQEHNRLFPQCPLSTQ